MTRILAAYYILNLYFLMGHAAHDDAFVGYEEKSVKCEDSDEGCIKWERTNQCIENAYYMREHCKKVCLGSDWGPLKNGFGPLLITCPALQSCEVPPECRSGHPKPPWEGVATAEGTSEGKPAYL